MIKLRKAKDFDLVANYKPGRGIGVYQAMFEKEYDSLEKALDDVRGENMNLEVLPQDFIIMTEKIEDGETKIMELPIIIDKLWLEATACSYTGPKRPFKRAKFMVAEYIEDKK